MHLTSYNLLLQHACRENDYELFKEFSEAVNDKRTDHIRHLLEFKTKAIDISRGAGK